jgi:maltose alpha-D-glucosyltransferase/alpha-amylase
MYLPAIIDPSYHFEALNVENQEQNVSSLLWWMRRLIEIRKRYTCFGRGTLEFITSDNIKVLSFIRSYKNETILVVLNLSRFMQVTSLELHEHINSVPVEIFSRNPLPEITDEPYTLTLGPYGHYWFLLTPQGLSESVASDSIPVVTIDKKWTFLRKSPDKTFLERKIIPGYVRECSWFTSKEKIIRDIFIVEFVPLGSTCLLIIKAVYNDGPDEWYTLPVAFVEKRTPEIDHTHFGNYVLCDAVFGIKK